MILAVLKTALSFAGGLFAEALEIAAVIWAKAGRLIATVLAVILACVALVQCGEVRTLQKANGELWEERNRLAGDLETCRGNVKGLKTALADQSARVEALGAESARRLADAEKAVQRAAQGRQEAERRASALLAASKGSAPVCDRLLALDKMILEQAR